MAYEIDPPTYVPPFVESRDEARSRLAEQRAMKWRRRAAGLAAGLAASRGASGFGESFLAGLSGSLGGVERFASQEEERQRARSEAAAREEERKQNEFYRSQTLALQNRADVRAQQDQDWEQQQRAIAPTGPDYHGFLPPNAMGPVAPGQERFPQGIPYTPETTKIYGEAIARGRAEQLFPAQPKPMGGLAQIAGPDGNPIWVRQEDAIGKPAAKGRPAVTGAERTALAFYNRAKGADDSIATADSAGKSLEDKMASLPLAKQAQLRYAPNVLQTSEQQIYRQAQRAFTEARLRKESGAAIPTHEYENDSRTYFAQPGDSKATIRAKRAARRIVLDGLKFSSGKAYDEYYGSDTGGGDVEWVMDPSGNLVPK